MPWISGISWSHQTHRSASHRAPQPSGDVGAEHAEGFPQPASSPADGWQSGPCLHSTWQKSKSLGKMMKNDQKSHFLLAFKDDWADCLIFQWNFEDVVPIHFGGPWHQCNQLHHQILFRSVVTKIDLKSTNQTTQYRSCLYLLNFKVWRTLHLQIISSP